MTKNKIVSRRDNFSKKVVDTLRSRVNNSCSNPQCKVPTLGPGVNEEEVLKLGRACHINAAAPGGPRFDKQMTSEQRKSISNGIWLCNSCAEMIDKECLIYTETILRSWKKISEQNARILLERGGNSADVFNIHPAIHGISVLGEIVKIDPRFSYELTFEKGVAPTIKLNPKERVDISFSAAAGKEIEVEAKMEGLIDFGKPFKIDRESVIISGTDIFNKLMPAGHLEFGNPGKDVQSRFQLFAADGSILGTMYASGKVWNGQRGVTANISLLEDLLHFEVFFEPLVGGQKITLEMEFNFKNWVDISILNLPNLGWMETIARCANSRGYLKADFKADGKWVSVIKKMSIDNEEINQVAYVLDCITAAKRLARVLGDELLFHIPSSNDIGQDEINEIAINLLKPYIRHADAIKWPIKLSGVKYFDANNQPAVGDLKVDENAPTKTIQVFGNTISLPTRRYLITEVTLKPDETQGDSSLFVFPTQKTTLTTYYPAFCEQEID